MQFKTTTLAGLTEVLPTIFEDERGIFLETYNQQAFEENGLLFDFVQDNHSWSRKGVLRGLHCQHPPYAQGKLVRCISGKVIDVAVDIRPDSATFGQHETFLLDSLQGNMVYVPEGFAHGFVALEDAIFAYKCTNFYHKSSESGILWNDPDLAIDWNVAKPIVSEKDLKLPSFKELTRQLTAQPVWRQ
ncbi:MAG: dTDP-4-dehydrorhamnose 3,5-epimerase [Cytophagaceae bacterium]|nr:dTDP-4-dehydrorhamnose 3,5-epimerase [Cytophagaceae bacterium]